LKTELKLSMQKRSLKAFIDLATLCALTNEPATGYGINTQIMNVFGFMTSSSVIYNNLPYLERKGWIKCIRNKTSRNYILTDQGKEITDNITSLTDQIRSFTVNLQKLKTHL
jgi:DNA-binding PadR family transcriptional regulator